MQDYAASGVASVVPAAFGVILFGIIRLRSHAGIKVDPDQLLINWLLTSGQLLAPESAIPGLLVSCPDGCVLSLDTPRDALVLTIIK
jgi:hypothetical protein